MNKQEVQHLSEKLAQTLKEFAEENGLESAAFKNITFDATSFKTTVVVTEKLDEEDKAKDFDMKAMMMGLPEGLYNKKITFQTKNFVIKDINTRAKKYPLVAEGDNGTLYKLPSSAVR